jgi:hypothetical protein
VGADEPRAARDQIRFVHATTQKKIHHKDTKSTKKSTK